MSIAPGNLYVLEPFLGRCCLLPTAKNNITHCHTWSTFEGSTASHYTFMLVNLQNGNLTLCCRP